MSKGKKRVLLVDDNRTLIMYMSMILNRMGFEVVAAENGLEGLKSAASADPNIVFLDITMPVMDGIKTLRKLKEDQQTAEIPVIMISIDSERRLVHQCEKLGCSGFLAKPVRLDKLHELLQECMFSNQQKRRKYLRCSFAEKVTVKHGSQIHDLYAETLSEGGIYIRKTEPFPSGTDVEVTLLLDSNEGITLKGTVIYNKVNFGGLVHTPLGMAVEFKEVTRQNARVLRDAVTRCLTGDILDCQEENIIAVETVAR